MPDNSIITNTPAGWAAENSVLLAGQIGLEIDVKNSVNTVPDKAKMGDGVTAYNALPYWNPSDISSGITNTAPIGSAVVTADADGNLEEGYQSYVALLADGDPPTATILGVNGIGDIVWARDGTGNVSGTLGGAFPADRTWCNVTPDAAEDPTMDAAFATLSRTAGGTVVLNTYSLLGVAANYLHPMQIEIRVYNA